MAAKNKYDVILEKVGNQPLKTTKVLCSALGLGLAAAKGMVDKSPVTIATGIDESKAIDLKKQLDELGNTVSVPGLKIEDEAAPAKKTTSNKTAAATDEAFDAIFGAGSAQKATPPVKSKGTTKTETKKATGKASAKAETKTTTKKKAAAASDDFDALFGDATPKTETKTTTKKSAPKVVDKKVVVGEYFAELAQLRQGIKDTGTYSGDGDMKPEIALAMCGDIDSLFACFKKETLSGYMRIARSDLEKQYKKLGKKIEKIKKAKSYDKASKCVSLDERIVPCVSYELAMYNLRANRPDYYIIGMDTTARDGDPRAIAYCQDYYSTNSEQANPYAGSIAANMILLNGKFDFYKMFYYAIRGIGFDYSPYYPDSEIAIPGWDFGRVDIEARRAEALEKLCKTLSYFVLPENIGTAEYKEHFGDFVPSELQIKIARHWFFIEDDRLVMSEETKKLRDEMKEKITNAVCNAPADAANTAKKTASAVKAATAETTSESESKTAPQIISLDLGDGDSYEGEMKDGKYHGMGTYRWGNGNVYTGEYVNGVRQGKGKFAFASGSSYEGEWKNGKYHGKGKWTNADGSYYTGVWENDDIIDSTKIEYPAPAYASESVKPAVGAKIERMEYDGGDVYEGEIVDGYRHGKGKYTWADGSEYEGDWVKGKKCGFGVYRSYSKNEKDGSTYLSYIYEGEWKDGKKHGQGIAKKYKIYHLFGTPFMTWSHEGGYANGDMHGHGIYKEWNVPNDTGRVHEGEWVNNKRQGRFVWEYEPSVTGKKYIDFYDQGHSVVFGIDYDPSIKTLEEAKRVKAENDAVRDRVIAERRATEAAQSSSPNDTSSDSDSEAVWEEFEYVEDLIEKLKNPELFDDPEDRWIANAYQYFEVFMDDVAANYSDADFATASEIFANILDLDVNGLQNYLSEKLGYIGDHYYVDYIETCLNYAYLHVTKDALIPFANLCYFRTKEIGINYMDLYVKAYSRHYVAKGEDILWFERYACNGDGFVSLSDEDDSRGNERGYGDSLRQMLTNGYRMGSDCRLYLPMKSLSEPYAYPSVGETYRMHHILSHVYDVGEWSGYSPYEDTDYQTWEHGSFAMDTYMAWMENEDEHTILFRNDGFTKRTGSRKGDYSKRRVALIPLRNYISNAMLANEQVRKSVPLSERLLYQRKLNEMVEEAMEYVRKGSIGAAFDEFQDAFDGGYEPKKLAEICYDVVRDVLQKNEDHWEFDDPYVEIMKLVALCDPESYAYFMSSIARESFGNYNHKYIYEVLTGEEYPG